MANRILDKDELAKVNDLLGCVRNELAKLADGDEELLFAYRRKIAKMLVYDERRNPMARRRLKIAKRQEQDGLCLICKSPLPQRYTVLDRYDAIKGYTQENTRLICEACDRQVQSERKYK